MFFFNPFSLLFFFRKNAAIIRRLLLTQTFYSVQEFLEYDFNALNLSRYYGNFVFLESHYRHVSLFFFSLPVSVIWDFILPFKFQRSFENFFPSIYLSFSLIKNDAKPGSKNRTMLLSVGYDLRDWNLLQFNPFLYDSLQTHAYSVWLNFAVSKERCESEPSKNLTVIYRSTVVEEHTFGATLIFFPIAAFFLILKTLRPSRIF